MDVTPLVRKGQQIIQSYAGGRFRISGTLYSGAVIVRPEETLIWDVSTHDAERLGESDFKALDFLEASADVILLGTGNSQVFLSPSQKLVLRGLKPEPMDTGAACRTYNVLMAGGRRVAAVLLPISIG